MYGDELLADANTGDPFVRMKLMHWVVAATMVVPSLSRAEVLTWDFSVLVTSGPGSGTTLSGVVSVDATGLPVGQGISQVGLLKDLDFAFDGTTFDETTANTGYLEFNPDGSLKALSFGTNCGPGYCGSAPNGATNWFLVIGSYREGKLSPDDFDFAGATTSFQIVRGDMTFSLRNNWSIDEAFADVARDVTEAGPGSSLADKIAIAQAYYAAGDITASCAILTDFQKQVRAQAGKKLTIEQATSLSGEAQTIRTAMGCE